MFLLVKKIFLFFIILTFFYLFFLVFRPKPILQSNLTSMEVESMLISSFLEKDEATETLLKLKLAVDDATSDEIEIEEKIADEILVALQASISPVVILKEKIKKVIITKKKFKPKPMVMKIKTKINIVQKKTKVLEEKKKIDLKKVEAKPVEPIVPVKTPDSSIEMTSNLQSPISLGEQDDIHTLSKLERKKFNHLEIVSISKIFALEPEQEIKSPIELKEVPKKIKLHDLELVKTLGVVAKSIPFIQREERGF